MWSLSHDKSNYKFPHVSVTSVQIEGRTYRVDDTPTPRSDGVLFGEDFGDPGDLKLSLLVNFQHVRNLTLQRAMLKEAAAAFLETWDAPTLRSQVGAVAELIIPTLGMFEGRPRRAEWDWSTYGLGYLIGAATFVRSTGTVYDLLEDGTAPWQEASVDLVPPIRGGLVAPLKAPLATTRASDRSKAFTVGGDTPAWPIIRVKGPISAGAQVELVSRWTVTITRALAYDQTAEIDCRPGRQASRLNGRELNVIAPTTDFSRLSMPPGVHALVLRGTSMEGTASASVRWRETKGAI